jgi:hypothetical protein
MSYRIHAALFRLGNPRKVGLIISLVMVVLALSGCGDIIPACPSGGTSGICGG